MQLAVLLTIELDGNRSLNGKRLSEVQFWEGL